MTSLIRSRISYLSTLATTLAATMLVGSSTAWAHPGHVVQVGAPESVAHYVLQPQHGSAWVWALAAVLGGMVLAICLRLTRKRRSLSLSRLLK